MSIIGGTGSTWWPTQQAEVRVSRTQLYNRAWSAPVRQLAAELGVSDHRLTTALRKHGIPLPQAGYRNSCRPVKQCSERRYRLEGRDRTASC